MYAPWYVIAWRLLWMIPLHLALLLYAVTVAITYGPRAGLDAFNHGRMH